MNEGRLAGKVCVVTGGARGLGLAVAEAIAAEGAAVALLDVLPQVAASAEALATSSGARTVGVVCNVTSEESVRAALDAVEESLGGADLLVNAAGVSLGTPALETSLDSWRRLIDINLTGTFLLCRDFARDCVVAGRPGAVVNFSSMSGHVVNVPQTQAGYNASKAAVSMLTKSLAVEWVHHNIRVNAVAPGYFLSDMTRDLVDAKPELRAEWEGRTPLGRLGDPKELRELVVYLLSDASSYIVGQDIVIDGGYCLV